MRSFTALVLGAALACSQYADAFSPAGPKSKILANLKEMRMSGAGGAAQPEYNEGESSKPNI